MTKYLVHSGTLSIQSPVKTGSSNNFLAKFPQDNQ